jgi:hypothetical protein
VETRADSARRGLIHVSATPKIEIDAENDAMTADGEYLVSESGR